MVNEAAGALCIWDMEGCSLPGARKGHIIGGVHRGSDHIGYATHIESSREYTQNIPRANSTREPIFLRKIMTFSRLHTLESYSIVDVGFPSAFPAREVKATHLTETFVWCLGIGAARKRSPPKQDVGRCREPRDEQARAMLVPMIRASGLAHGASNKTAMQTQTRGGFLEHSREEALSKL